MRAAGKAHSYKTSKEGLLHKAAEGDYIVTILLK